jgi:hypothetical protein
MKWEEFVLSLHLNDDERNTLAEVLELRPSLNRKNNPKLEPLSLYSSELKSLKQIASNLNNIRASGIVGKTGDDEKTRARYFNTLSNIGLVDGTAISPVLTGLAVPFLQAYDSSPGDEYWRDHSNGLETQLLREISKVMASGGEASDFFKCAWYNAQCFFERVPESEIDDTLNSLDKLLFLFHIHSAGWEIERYFNLPHADRTKFEKVFEKIPRSDKWTPTAPIEIAASKYKDAGAQFQMDVRYRISGFLNGYRLVRDEMGTLTPYLTRNLEARTSTAKNHQKTGEIGTNKITSAAPLNQPLQLIVTGCPGSGKSHYVDKLVKAADCAVFRTQFHPETTFFDFVGAFKPQPIYENTKGLALLEMDGSAFGYGRPLIDYRFVPGVFVRAYIKALQSPSSNVVLLIEELNRGNTAAIFGDLLQLLDRSSDGWSKYDVLPSPELKSYLERMGVDGTALRLPPNLYIWSTMNSADQGVFPLDTAFRRRWSYVYMGYSEVCGYVKEKAVIRYDGKNYSWDTFRSTLNQKLITLGVHEDKLIGPYFLNEDQLADPDAILEKLFLYIWDDVLRFRQDELFSQKSFAEVAQVWAKGAGSPLQLTLPAPIDPAVISASAQLLPPSTAS